MRKPLLSLTLPIGVRLFLSFALMLALLMAVGFVSIKHLQRLANVTQSIVEVQSRRAFLAQSANEHALTAANDLLKLLLTQDRDKRVQLYADMDSELAASDEAVTSIAQTVQSPEDAEQLKRVNTLRNEFDKGFRETVDLIELNGPTGARTHFETVTKKALENLLHASLAMATAQQQRVVDDLAELQIAQAKSITVLITIALAALFTGILLAIYMTRSIVNPVREAIGFAENIADGRLDGELPPGRDDEVGKLLRALGLMRDSIASREVRIMRLAYEDALTGLPNRTRLLQDFEHAGADRNGALLVLNIDRFGLINNALGPDVGDQLLRQIGHTLHTLPGDQSIEVYRLWGDEFAFWMDGANCEAASDFANSVAMRLQLPLEVDGQRLDVSGTLGIAMYPADERNIVALLRRATLAMRWSKQRYRQFALAAEAPSEPRHENLALIGELRDALQRSELVAHYQPKYDFVLGKITGVEALLRWNHPERGLIPPGHFIPFAEQTGFIREVTPWLLDHVMAQSAQWRRDGFFLVPSVNLSALDLLTSELIGTVGSLLQKYQLEPSSICLEITESALMSEPELSLRHLNELASMGVKLSIDDYGTGHASLSYLKTLPVNELKIDRAFVRDIDTTSRNAAIVRSTTVLCHELGISVVAEGAETSSEMECLRTLDCDLVQGFVIARPMPAAEFIRWFVQVPPGKQQVPS